MTPPVTRASIANVERGKQGVLAFTLVQIARELRAAPSDLLPSESMAATAPQEQKQVENELALKLSVPPAASKRLTEKLLAEPASARRKHERSSRTTSR
jgi:transcriptional regulator with XRE-family HTH domain